MVKNSPDKSEACVQSLGGEDPLKKEMATHSSIVWEVPWTEEPGGLCGGRKETDTPERLISSSTYHKIHRFKVYDSVAFGLFTRFRDHHHYLAPDYFITPKRSSTPICSRCPLFLPPCCCSLVAKSCPTLF